VYETARPGPGVLLPAGWVSVGYLLPRAEASLADEAFTADPSEMQQVGAALADLLLLPELCSPMPYSRPDGPEGAYPRWATTYYAEPPLGGQNKRWFVVSHDHFNAATGDAVCVRTTSNTDYSGPETPLIEGGTAMAVCPDVQTKAHRRFFLDSAGGLPQVRTDERRKVAFGLANYLGLQHFAADTPPR
jgi:mRNA-degrading endonuclease toxin of MazEF toxin-antitoxin module